MKFDPFESRLCRDVRNRLGHAFVLALQARDMRPFAQAAGHYPADTLPLPVRDYIRRRRDCLTAVLERIPSFSPGPADGISIPLLLWNLELFFEFHEWMEIQWQSARGPGKKACQSLILCAVTHEHLLYGKPGPAQKSAARACLMLNEYRNALPEGFDADLLIQKMSGPDPLPPKFDLPV